MLTYFSLRCFVLQARILTCLRTRREYTLSFCSYLAIYFFLEVYVSRQSLNASSHVRLITCGWCCVYVWSIELTSWDKLMSDWQQRWTYKSSTYLDVMSLKVLCCLDRLSGFSKDGIYFYNVFLSYHLYFYTSLVVVEAALTPPQPCLPLPGLLTAQQAVYCCSSACQRLPDFRSQLDPPIHSPRLSRFSSSSSFTSSSPSPPPLPLVSTSSNLLQFPSLCSCLILLREMFHWFLCVSTAQRNR